MKRPQQYVSYLLRMWRSADKKAAWRASLESPMSRERQTFASLRDLFAFLETVAGGVTDEDTETNMESEE